MKILAALLLALLLGACAGLRPSAPAPAPVELFSDAAFGAPSETIGASELFALSPEMRAYLHSAEFTGQLRAKGAERGLIDALYKKGELRLEYDSSMTRNAAQTFRAHAGNCLSLVIMTAAFAKELGLTVHYQAVLAGENWSLKGGMVLSSSHVNLGLGKAPIGQLQGWERTEMLTIDFLPPEDIAGYRTSPLDEDAIVAMYMNNRAAEALVSRRIDDAYWWARAALERQPGYAPAYNTLAVIYQRHGDLQQAERAFRAALERDPNHLPSMQNLVPLLAALGKDAESQALARRVAAIEPNPPFYFFNLGKAAMQRADYQQARAMFAREVQRAPYYDEFHFWLALACLRLGEPDQAREQLALAHETSTTPGTRDLYSAKLARLRALNPGARQERTQQ
jgi:tetratricopeptide (TPR) repeat protein